MVVFGIYKEPHKCNIQKGASSNTTVTNMSVLFFACSVASKTKFFENASKQVGRYVNASISLLWSLFVDTFSVYNIIRMTIKPMTKT